MLNEIFKHQRPFFLYSQTELHESIQKVQKFWSRWSQPGFRIYYSVKVNPNPYLLKILAGHVHGFDISSRHEARIAMQAGAQHLTWSGPAKTLSSAREILKMPIEKIHVDSSDELRQITRLCRQENWNLPELTLRVGLKDIQVQKLGVGVRELASFLPEELKKIKGFHTYFGRESFSAKMLESFFAALSEFNIHWQNHLDVEFPTETFIGAALSSSVHSNFGLADQEFPPGPVHKMNLEGGRAVVQSCGTYGTQVLAIKRMNDHHLQVIVDGGLQHMATNFLSPRFQDRGVQVKFYRGDRELTERGAVAAISGSLSLWHDILMPQAQIPTDLKRGDWIVVNNCGAYGWTAGSNQFLAPSPVREWLIDEAGRLKDISPTRWPVYTGSEVSS